MNIYTTIVLEFLLISSSILLLFKYRTKFGLAPLYILLGSVQYLQALSGSMISFNIFDEYPIYPGSVIIFSAVLFAILLIYIKEGVASARTLIIAIIISNVILSALFGITYVQENATQIISLEDPSSIFQINYNYFITGTIILFLDFFLLIIIYQFLISKLNKLYFFLILFISLCSVLIFDSLVFNFILKYGTPIFTTSLIGHIIGKSFSAVIFSLILYIYLKYIDKEEDNAGFMATQNREIFSILTYRKKYFNLKEEKKEVEEKYISQIESTLNQISDGFVSLDNDWCYTYVNKKAGEFLGRSPESLIGKYIWTEFPKGVNLPFYHAYYKAVNTQQTQYLIEYYEPFDKWFENRIYPSPDGLSIYFTDFTERKKAEEELIKSKIYLDNIINNIGDPVFVKNDKSEMILVNDALCALFNMTRAEILGKTLAENVPIEERESFLRIDKQVILTGIENINEEALTMSENETRIISTKKTRFVDSSGNKFLVGVIRDITDRKKTEIELEKHRNNLEELVDLRTTELEKEKVKAQSADLMKSAFLATMSHELRTPMNSIIGFTGILLKEFAGPLNAEQRKQLTMVKTSGQHLLGLINDVLDISKIEAGKLKVSLYHFNYLTTLEKTIDFLVPQASKKDIVIHTEISEMQILLFSDERRVEQILLNILSNAIKFSNKGAIHVKVAINANLVVTQIIDQGVGISKKDLNKLFEPFIQLEGGLRRSHEGTGLGLAICKSLIEKLGGTINVQSKKGVGSTFTFTLPVDSAIKK
jgi:PAS domain S-box-containing protein